MPYRVFQGLLIICFFKEFRKCKITDLINSIFDFLSSAPSNKPENYNNLYKIPILFKLFFNFQKLYVHTSKICSQNKHFMVGLAKFCPRANNSARMEYPNIRKYILPCKRSFYLSLPSLQNPLAPSWRLESLKL